MLSDIYGDEAITDPYSFYGRLRETSPVHWDQAQETWLVTRHATIVWLLRNPDLFSSRFYADDPRPPSPPIDAGDTDDHRSITRFRAHEMIQNDRPDHGRMRAPFARFFTPGRMEEWRTLVADAVRRILDDVEARDSFDVVRDVAHGLPLEIIAELMGIDPADREELRRHADQRMQSALSLEPDRMRVAACGIRDTSAYLGRRLDRRTWTGDDLMGLLFRAEEGGSLTRDEVLANAQLLIDAGHETTIQLIANGVLALLTHRDQWELLCADPDAHVVGAVEEALRYDPPLPAPRRIAARDLEIDGHLVRAGERVTFVIAAGNRDPRAFDEPDAFRIDRSPNRHIAFGSGLHVCLGQYLARLEGQEVFRALARRMPDLQLTTSQVDYARVRGVRSLLALGVDRRR